MASPLKNAKGLGSAKHGLNHWITQRATAIALVPLTIWFVVIVAMMKDSSYQNSFNLVSNPFNATILILLVITMKFCMTVIGLLSALSVLRIAL